MHAFARVEPARCSHLVIFPPDTMATLPLNGFISARVPKRRWSATTASVAVITSGAHAARPARTRTDQKRGSSCWRRLFFTGAVGGGVCARMSAVEGGASTPRPASEPDEE
eukprot:5912207-Prymnesium_polylepis.1